MKQLDNMLLMLEENCNISINEPRHVRELKVSGMKFRIRSYHAPELGHISVMEATGFFGLMKMDTLIITPMKKDMPLLSYDRVLAMGNDTLIFELYDTLLGDTDLSALESVKNSISHIPEHELGAHWYDSIKLPLSLTKKGKKSHTALFDETASQYLEKYLLSAENAPACEADPKRKKASVYVEGLLENGGPPTKLFQKSLGKEKTSELFRIVLFGTHA
jgi:hypothetical protein